jgi:hypothetical protein
MTTTTRKTRLLVVVAGIAALAVTGTACGGGSSAAARKPAASTTATAPTTVPTPVVADSLYGFQGINFLANEANLGVIGTVTAISRSTLYMFPLPHEDGYPQQYGQKQTHDVTILVQRVIFDSPDATATVGQPLTITVEDGDEDVTTPSGVAIPKADLPGHYEVGAKVLALLIHVPKFPAPNGTRDTFVSAEGYQGNWTVAGDTAKNANPKRSVPLEALIGRIIAERKSGRNPNRDAGTQENPLANPSN